MIIKNEKQQSQHKTHIEKANTRRLKKEQEL